MIIYEADHNVTMSYVKEMIAEISSDLENNVIDKETAINKAFNLLNAVKSEMELADINKLDPNHPDRYEYNTLVMAIQIYINRLKKS